MSSPPTPPSSQPHLSSAETARAVLERLSARRAPTSRYSQEKEIARGGMGAILAAEDVDLRRQVAIKVAHGREDGSSAGDPQGLYRFLEEAQVTAQLSHPGIVPVHELGIDARGRVFFSMALVQGEDLERVFARVRAGEAGWTQTRVLGVLQRVCETMAYAHSRDVISAPS